MAKRKSTKGQTTIYKHTHTTKAWVTQQHKLRVKQVEDNKWCNQKPKIEEGQKIQWSKDQTNVGKTLHRKQSKDKSLCNQDNQMVLNWITKIGYGHLCGGRRNLVLIKIKVYKIQQCYRYDIVGDKRLYFRKKVN